MAGADNRNRHRSTNFLYDIDIFFMLIIRFGQIKYENTQKALDKVREENRELQMQIVKLETEIQSKKK